MKFIFGDNLRHPNSSKTIIWKDHVGSYQSVIEIDTEEVEARVLEKALTTEENLAEDDMFVQDVIEAVVKSICRMNTYQVKG